MNDEDYKPPFPLIAKLNKLTIEVDRPQLSPEDVKKLEAAMRRDQGKRAEAHDLLAPVYGWFTEGLDTPVLKEANALLEQLSA